jgi:hypothetical protein
VRGAGPWEVLGIDATGDRTAIRQAYAARLKVTNPEDDAEGFQTLRAAYEHALAIAQHWDEDDEDTVFAEAPVTAEPPAPAYAEPAPPAEPDAFDVRHAAAPERPWGAPREVAEHVTRGELDALNAALARLAEIVHAPEVDRDAARQALRVVLEAPAMDSMGVRDQVEHQIGVLIVNSGMGGAVLIDPSSRAFGWDSDRLGGRSPLGAAVLERREDLHFLLTIKSPGSDLNGAWRALSEKPKGLRLVWNHLTLGLPGQVRQVLDAVYHQHRSLLNEFDAEALTWWQARLERPWFGPVMVWTVFVGPLILTPMMAATDVFGEDDGRAFSIAYPTSLAAVLMLLVGVLGLARLQALWRREREYEATPWETLCWAPVSLASLAGAALAPAWAGVFAFTGVAAAVWAVATAERNHAPDMVDAVWSFPASWFPWIQFPFRAPVWLMRTFGLIAILFFWIALAEQTPASAWLALSGPGLAAGLAFVAGHDRLDSAWRGLPGQARTAVLIAGAAGVAALPYWLWTISPDPGPAPVAFAVVAAVVLVERIVSLSAPTRLRDQLYHLGWLPALFATILAEDEARHANSGLLFLGIWLLAGAAAGLIGALRRERWTRAASYA